MKTIKSAITLTITLIALCSSAQTVDYNRIVIPETVKSVTFEERLVQLAWRNHPSNKITEEEVNIAKKEKAIATWSWLDNIYAVGNLNEFTIEGNSSERQIFYPRYNFGVRLSLGTFVKTPLDTRVAESRLLNSVLLVNQKKIQVRSQVLTQVERLKENYKVLKLRQNLKEEYYQMYQQMKNKFQLNEVTLDKLQSAQESYFSQTESMISIQSTFNQEKLFLEALLGLRLEDISGYQEFITRLEEELKAQN